MSGQSSESAAKLVAQERNFVPALAPIRRPENLGTNISAREKRKKPDHAKFNHAKGTHV